MYDKHQTEAKQLINTKWLKESRLAFSRWPKNFPRSDFNEEVCDMITLLSRVKGLPMSSTFQEWMYEYIQVMRKKKSHIDWGAQISDEIHEKLIRVPTTLTFYMNSYLAYASAAIRQYQGLTIDGDRKLVPVYKLFPQITLKGIIKNFRRVSDALFAPIFCMFDPSLSKKIIFYEAWEVVNKYGCVFLQFPTFTYLKVGCFKGYPYILPRYPSDKWVLMELCRQVIMVHTERRDIHKTWVKFPITIGSYYVKTMPKTKCVETKMQNVNLRTYHRRVDFD
jgi:hypothetical protein